VDLQSIGKLVALTGVALALVGGMLWLGGRLGFGSLPGDLRFSGEGWSCYVPIVASIVLSLLLTLVLNFIIRFMRR
jgi:hypothetical protein